MNRNPVISLSTCWCSHRFTDGYKMLAKMADLGFEYAELSHGIRVSLVPGILRAVKENVIKISSLHNFCPLPMGFNHAAPNIYEPTSKDARERAQWHKNTLRTIDFAGQVGAHKIVLHSGSVRFFWGNPVKALQRFKADRIEGTIRDNAAYQNKLMAVLEKLRKRSKVYRDNLIESFNGVAQIAKSREITFGIENRESLSELPMDHDMGMFLLELSQPEVFGYWHDAGHAQLKEQWDIITQEQLLSENADRLVGLHIHDVTPEGRDHQPLGTGVIKFEKIIPFINENTSVILELSPSLKTPQVKASRDYLLSLLANPGASK